MDMKTCIFLTLGLLVGSGSGYSIDRPAGSTDNLQPPPLTPTPYAHQVKPLPSSKPARLGIVPGTVPQALVAQLELSGFPGVLVTKVMPDSPAAKAGLQENDVMVKLGDVSLSGPQSVTEALSEKVPGDRITAVFYRKGKRETVEITLDGGTLSAEEILAAQGDPRTQPRAVPSVRRQTAPFSGMAARPNLPRRILQGLHQMPMPPMGKVSGGGQSMSSVRMSDANGTIVVSSNSRTGTTVHVTDSAGKVLYSGPYNTQEEKSAVPEAVRERLKNIETNFCF